MNTYRIVITERAEVQLRTITDWWRANRPAAPELFLAELNASLERVASAPLSGSPYNVPRPSGVRRVLFRRTRFHLYYTVDERLQVVTVRAVWHATRGQRPNLG